MLSTAEARYYERRSNEPTSRPAWTLTPKLLNPLGIKLANLRQVTQSWNPPASGPFDAISFRIMNGDMFLQHVTSHYIASQCLHLIALLFISYKKILPSMLGDISLTSHLHYMAIMITGHNDYIALHYIILHVYFNSDILLIFQWLTHVFRILLPFTTQASAPQPILFGISDNFVRGFYITVTS